MSYLIVEGKAFKGWFLSKTNIHLSLSELYNLIYASLIYFSNKVLEGFPLLSNNYLWVNWGFCNFMLFIAYYLHTSDETISIWKD
jgi:hypothetical protein